MESGVTLADIRKEETLQRNCTKVGIVYIPRTANETEQERDARHHQLQLAIKSKRRIENKSQQSPDKERRIRESNVPCLFFNPMRVRTRTMKRVMNGMMIILEGMILGAKMLTKRKQCVPSLQRIMKRKGRSGRIQLTRHTWGSFVIQNTRRRRK